jgi:hypothetical protein
LFTCPNHPKLLNCQVQGSAKYFGWQTAAGCRTVADWSTVESDRGFVLGFGIFALAGEQVACFAGLAYGFLVLVSSEKSVEHAAADLQSHNLRFGLN